MFGDVRMPESLNLLIQETPEFASSLSSAVGSPDGLQTFKVLQSPKSFRQPLAQRVFNKKESSTSSKICIKTANCLKSKHNHQIITRIIIEIRGFKGESVFRTRAILCI